MAVGLGLVAAVAIGESAMRVIAVFAPDVRYLATTRTAAAPRRFRSLPEYLASKPEHVVPYRRWFNYWTNALGFNDEEFVLPKPAGRFRIMAVGDSATYGLVPYPQNVMTVLESALRAACPERDLDLLNFGVAATGVDDYRAVIELGLATYEPDLVLINFYAGNDAPNLYDHAHPRRRGLTRTLLRHSYLWTYTRNVLALRRSVPDLPGLVASVGGPAPAELAAGQRPRGGHIVDPGLRLRDDDPALVGPVFGEEAFMKILDDELGRFYTPGDAGEVERAWRPTLEELDAARAHVVGHGGRLVITLYPSTLQVDPDLRAALVDRLRRRHPGLTPALIDSSLPNRVVAGYCRTQGLSCFDLTPAFVRASQEAAAPLYKARDAHWTPRGNRVAAQAQSGYLAPLACPAAGRPPSRGVETDRGPH
jgi:hypothetical protein